MERFLLKISLRAGRFERVQQASQRTARVHSPRVQAGGSLYPPPTPEGRYGPGTLAYTCSLDKYPLYGCLGSWVGTLNCGAQVTGI